MPTFSSSLENAIHASLAYATQRNHELATLEHLLLALIDEPNASRVMRACAVSLDELRAKLTHFLENELDSNILNSDIQRQMLIEKIRSLKIERIPSWCI